ncbi:hypothetical protein GUJ93_ZPchr0012g20828 [Zizania palustris]|uniref:DUF834 domain-containing protein n=1 Tax=Zizania palustris TaxID=103762 RepID=A0A8J5WRP5_ZIZPA|nr:hypothetical protein GUJ93_ZPchr0012g20828 [Zizania palustris]
MAGGGEIGDEVPVRRRGGVPVRESLSEWVAEVGGVVAVPDEATTGREAAFGGEEVWLETGGVCGERKKLARRSDS